LAEACRSTALRSSALKLTFSACAISSATAVWIWNTSVNSRT
jgi:hypothetical protein